MLMEIMGSGPTNNEQLEKIGIYLFGSLFKGVHASDQMPLLKKNEMCIVNTDDSKGRGVHWNAYYKYRNIICVYDSFDRDVKSLLEHWKKNTIGSMRIQTVISFTPKPNVEVEACRG